MNLLKSDMSCIQHHARSLAAQEPEAGISRSFIGGLFNEPNFENRLSKLGPLPPATAWVLKRPHSRRCFRELTFVGQHVQLRVFLDILEKRKRK
ncbi:hypothetical protein I7I50_09507 [Histoplasma capsulatum G186AR]|uniref:Uncharacterized protein n=1 Tax=Ajellomyces capsulatus TaxID=5037 RepID=A0A8H7YRH9_AJECA|nr:hypothetical protein I7I52_07028 [Histoplasma capsulatum]QSS74375.1 hypothetical protein I7I50_09507 [Histoplasma capsulatum G186AR]